MQSFEKRKMLSAAPARGTCRHCRCRHAASSACRISSRRQGPQGLTATLGRQRAGVGDGGKGVPALAQAARATCRLGKGAAIQRWCFLTNFFRGGPFWHFVGAGGIMCQKFRRLRAKNVSPTKITHQCAYIIHHSWIYMYVYSPDHNYPTFFI
jgi:hypothetical protein